MSNDSGPRVLVLDNGLELLLDEPSPGRFVISRDHATPARQGAVLFQQRVGPWLVECFGEQVALDVQERCDRFLEEALEKVQAYGYDPARIATLVNYVFNRPVGDPFQEAGGVMVTLAALCWATGVDLHAAAETELGRILQPEVMEKIRKKQASKRGLHTPLPVPPGAGVH